MSAVALVMAVVQLAALAWLAVTAVRARASARGSWGWQPTDVLEAAFLAGGPGRVADTVLAVMHEGGLIRVTTAPGGSRVDVLRPTAREPVERAVLAAVGGDWSAPLAAVRAQVMRDPSVQEIGDSLAAAGLLYPPPVLRHWRRVALVFTLVVFATIPLSVLAAILTTAPGPALGILTAFVTLVVGGLAFAPRSARTTPAGREALRGLRARNPWAPPGTVAVGGAVAGVVAVAGVGELVDAALREQLMAVHRTPVSVYVPGTSTSYTESSSPAWCGSSGGGSSCGGGGGAGGEGGFSGGSSCGGSSGSSCGGSSGGSSCGGGSSS
ncbi:TIGR04222 domain-containing membrane protein [Streptomyces polyrhachis]|uniref:TIGR04222 domain-containing membrane protein n=1 Tax=Streptomyces polyrhachis TaxID=1282885 RepID=A0ABW2GCC8_9ACTN